MKFTPSSIVSQASGSMGGITAARNRYGMYLRNRVIPVNQKTLRQLAVREAMSQLAAAWADTLTSAQRAAWQLYGENVGMPDAFGAIQHLPGKEMYVRSNIPRLQAALTAVDDGPALFSLPPAPAGVTVTGTQNDQKLSIAFDNTEAWAGEVGAALLILCGRPQNTTRNFYGGPWRYAGKIAGATPDPPESPQLLDAPFPFVDGQLLFCQFRVSRADGRLSTPFQSSGLATAGA